MFKNIFSKKLTINDVTLNVDQFSYQGEQNGINVWHTEEGDSVGIYYFEMAPDLPVNIKDKTTLISSYEQQLSSLGGEIVELELIKIDGVNTIFLIIKVPQEPSGMTYIMSYTIPFKTFSFVVKAQCQEYGATGIKEAMLFDRILEEGGDVETSNMDSHEYDNEFPSHPLTRARKISKSIVSGLSISETIKSHEPF